MYVWWILGYKGELKKYWGQKGQGQGHNKTTYGQKTTFGAILLSQDINELSQRLVRYCSVEDATLEVAVCCRW